MKGLQMQRQFTQLQETVINRLAEIESEDANRCNGCGGEDCICCEYWHDRQKWQSPDELFSMENENCNSILGDYDDPSDNYDFYCDECNSYVDEWCDECDCCPDCCNCEV